VDETHQQRYVSRGGLKLAAALDAFGIDPAGCVCADLGSNVGGFVDCLLQRGAQKVYAIDTGYGVLAWALRRDERVVVMERTNAMHATLPEPVDLVTIDAGWTRQQHILPNALRMLGPTGRGITLIKPHYEAEPDRLASGVLDEGSADEMLQSVCDQIRGLGAEVLRTIRSPITGQKGNVEFFALVRPARDGAGPKDA
jgi:23S rRNA (cytidine1920-2'-O)/16S rRNA (cytidine1409-2'-O)-methyltransferase